MTYEYDQVLAASLEYFNGDDLAAKVFADKYALQDRDNKYHELDPSFMHRRLAREFARAEAKYPSPMNEEEIFELFDRFKYVVPQGSPMSAIGNDFQMQSASNCFVIPAPHDSYAGICKTDQEEAQIMKRRGGVGFDISTIRPKGLNTENAARTTDGISVFMERFSNTCREVAQGGRRGALMITISVHHPEIRTFINIKRDRKKVTGANISIRITDEFMEAVKSDADYQLRFPCNKGVLHTVEQMVSAREIWNEIIDAAWDSAEPGLLFWDTAKKNTPADIYSAEGFSSESTNPCGEIVLSEYDSCRLMAMNLLSYVSRPFAAEAEFDYELFSRHVQKAQRLMDDLIDIEIEQVKKIIKKIKADPEPDDVKAAELRLWINILDRAQKGRRTGLGVTALGDTLAALGVKYGSEQSIVITEEIYRTLAVAAYTSSAVMAGERGAFPVYDSEKERDHQFIRRIMDTDENLRRLTSLYGRRNIAILTTAPTGSVSTLTQTTSGIESVYLPFYTRRKKINASDKEAKVDYIDQMGDKWQEFTVYHHGLKKWMDLTGETEVEKSPYFGASSADVDWVSSVRLQAAAQKWVCHAISKTCNVPESTPKEVIADVYMKAWESGCKGFTVYREGSRSGVLIKKEEKTEDAIAVRHAPKRPEVLPCEVHTLKVDSKPWVCFVSTLDNKPYEIFTGLEDSILPPKKMQHGAIVKRKNGKKESKYDLYFNRDQDTEIVYKDITNHFKNDDYGAQARLISLALRHGVPTQHLVEQLQKIENEDLFSFNKVIARVMKSYIEEGAKTDKECPSCGEKALVYQEGCPLCKNCGYSKC